MGYLGRTGVFMTTEIALLNFQHNLPVDLPDIVKTLRTQRIGLVQTEVQYNFIYKTLTYIRRSDNEPGFNLVSST